MLKILVKHCKLDTDDAKYKEGIVSALNASGTITFTHGGYVSDFSRQLRDMGVTIGDVVVFGEKKATTWRFAQ